MPRSATDYGKDSGQTDLLNPQQDTVTAVSPARTLRVAQITSICSRNEHRLPLGVVRCPVPSAQFLQRWRLSGMVAEMALFTPLTAGGMALSFFVLPRLLKRREEKTQKNQCWKSLFIDTYSDVGRYIDHYAAIKKAWDDLKKYLEPRCPRMVLSLKEGAREEDLDAVEAQIGCKLPDDYRCSYRIHNGQKLVVPGLLGSMALSNHYRSEDLLDVDTAAGGFQQRQGLKYCLPLTFCIHTGLSQYIAVEAAEGRNKNEVFYQCPDQMARNPAAIDMFIIGATFTDWFTSYVNSVVSGGFPIIRDQIFRYVHDPECVATTGDITVSVSTSFLPELSSVHPPHYFFTYRIRIEMSKDALPEKACQLDSRYWRITNAKGDVEEVQGPGVVGEFPIISPGRVYEYTSCTTFSTTSGYMEGYYTFHFLYFKDKIFNVAIPRFHMACPTFRVSIARLELGPDEYEEMEDAEEEEDDDSADMEESDEEDEEARPRRLFDVPIRRRRYSRLF
ncbi:F-box only protein 3 [Myotis brandtii]|uniref:F-box only protein 3 n=1 Tax=Myotis brandtii TaxID=109478 RepID=S7MQL2_MYOBR|nr:F-box only protein 3 [Myotis brandtii]